MSALSWSCTSCHDSINQQRDKVCKSRLAEGKTEHINGRGGHLNLSSDVGHQLHLSRGRGNGLSSPVRDDGQRKEERVV